MKELCRSDVCFENVDKGVQRRSEGIALCLCGSVKSIWQGYCMSKSGVCKKYVRLVQDMYEGSVTVVGCTVGGEDSR